MKQKLIKTIKVIFTLYAFLLFLICLFLVLPFVYMASSGDKIKGGNTIYKICTIWANIMLSLLGIKHRHIYEAPHDKSHCYVFVFNHISYLDIPILISALAGHPFRILGKAELAKVPVFGFVYRKATVLVDRTNAARRAKSVAELKSYIAKGVSVAIAPEGTFNETPAPLKNFYDGAFRIAIETQTPIKPILILDTYDRLSYKNIFSLNPGKTRVVFLDEVVVEGLTLENLPVLKNEVYRIMEDKLLYYQASWAGSNTRKDNHSA